MSSAVFPTLVGQGWSVIKTPRFATRVQRSVSGRELRAPDMPNPIWTFTLVFEYLPAADLNTLLGFFLSRQGAYDPFLFNDPNDNSVTAQPIGTGDGATTSFQLGRDLGGFWEPVTAPGNLIGVYANGIAQSGCEADPATGILTMPAPPAAGLAITADFTFYFRCRFVDDSNDFENFMQNLWRLQKLQFVSVLP